MFGAQAGSAADGCREAAAVTASRSMQYNRPLYRVFYNQKAFVQITPARYGGCELATQDVCFVFQDAVQGRGHKGGRGEHQKELRVLASAIPGHGEPRFLVVVSGSGLIERDRRRHSAGAHNYGARFVCCLS